MSTLRSSSSRPALLVVLALAALSGGCPEACGPAPCEDCVDLGGLTAREHTARYFPITGGSPHDDTACIGCHANPTTFADFTCTSCHDHAAEVMDERHIPMPDYVFDSGVGCRTCHPAGRADRDPSFAHTFPVATETKHGPVSCASCHRTPGAVKTVTCVDCHDHQEDPTAHDELPMGAVHAAVASYAWESVKCLSCHPNAEPVGIGIDHETTFPIGPTTAHGGLACTDCHTNPDDRAVIACKSCHEVETEPDLLTPHADVGEFILDASGIDDALCLKCHADAQVNRVLLHSFPIHAASAFEPAAAHHGERCFDCHREVRSDKPFGADFTVQTCVDCHTADGAVDDDPPAGMDAVHDGIPDYVFANLACRTCHPNSEPSGTMMHDDIFPISTKTSHEAVTCDECHVDDQDRRVLGCQQCHAKPEVIPADLFTAHVDVGELQPSEPAVTSNDCARCHAESQVDPIKDHAPFGIHGVEGASPAAPHHLERCTACHTADREDKAWATDFAAIQACTSCHEAPDTDPVHAVVPLYSFSDVSCRICHPDGKRISYVDHEATFPIATATKHGGLACVDCHIDPLDATSVGCKECHQVEDNLPLLHVDVGEF